MNSIGACYLKVEHIYRCLNSLDGQFVKLY